MTDLLCANTITEAALTIAVTQIGVREKGGNNRGVEVEMYLASVGGLPGESWCAGFVYWCFRRASNVLTVANPCPRTRGAQKIWKLSDARFHRTAPSRGSLFVMDHGEGLGHVGFVEMVYPDGSISTVEGNTNRDGARNGDSVWQHVSWNPLDGKRGILMGYVDLAEAVQLPSPVG